MYYEYDIVELPIDPDKIMSKNPNHEREVFTIVKTTLNKYAKDGWEYVGMNLQATIPSLMIKRLTNTKKKRITK